MRKSLDTSVLGVFAITEGRLVWQAKSGGQVRSYTSNVSEVSRVSEASKMSKQGEQQSLEFPRPLRERTNLLANECELRNSGEGSDKSALTHGETAKDANDSLRHPELVSGSHHAASLEDVTPHQVRTKLARRSLSPTILSRKGRGTCAAFTLAEVLITLAIIGVVAVLTIPGLIKNHNEKAWSTAQDVFTKRLEVATRQMNTEEKLAGYANTMDFVNELKKYIKITRVCDNSEITKCFNKQVIWNEGDEPIDMSQIKTSASLGQSDWNTDTVAVQFANGVNAIIAYNPNATQDPYNNQFAATSASMAILYDVSGNKSPNTFGKDISQVNVSKVGKNCTVEFVGNCFSAPFIPTPLTNSECENLKESLGIEKCSSNNSDYWGGAVKACNGINNLPTMETLSQIATIIYEGNPIIDSYENRENLVYIAGSASSIGLPEPTFALWSNEESGYYRRFLANYTEATPVWRGYSGVRAMCIIK